MKNLLSILFLLATTTTLFAQGTIRGKLVDADTQEELIGATIRVDGTSLGAMTDFEGTYSIEIPAGTYTITHSYIGYQDKKISDVVVEDAQVNALGTITLGVGGDSAEIEEVVVTAYVQKNSEEGLLNFQMNSSKIVDAISAQTITKSGDSDVAAVVKRVPGVTIEGGKYVYVRGLGDRYSKSILNGMEIPGLDAERNTVQMDIFPSNIVDNIVVYKTFSPDLPGDFSGGMIDVTTKDFPLEKYTNFGLSVGANSQATFNDDYINYDGSNGDAFAFGAKDRELPFSKDFDQSKATLEEVSNNTKALNDWSNTNNETALPNVSFNFTTGDQIDTKGTYRLGYNLAANYKQSRTFKPEYNQTIAQVRNNPTLRYETISDLGGQIGTSESLLNGIASIALKNTDNSYSLKLLHTRTGEKSATSRFDDNVLNTQFNEEKVLDYFNRSLSNVILSGEHFLANNSLLDWGNAFTYAKVGNPDRTSSSLVVDDDGTYSFTGSGDSSVRKDWRDLNEISNNAKLNYEMPFNTISEDSKLKFGLSSFYKDRNYEAYGLTMDIYALSDADKAELATIKDFGQIMSDENIFTPSKSGYRMKYSNSETNSYDAQMHVAAGYFMGDLELTEKLKFIGGLRVENAIMHYKGVDRVDFSDIDKETLNSTQFLPSANFVYELQDYMKVRASFNRTIARPSFKEKSEAIIFDPINNTTFYGDTELEETGILNYDLRWEYSPNNGEIISISPFYKKMKNPIEYQALNESSGPDDILAVNKDEATLLGAELEARKNLGFAGAFFENISFNGNITVVESKIDVSEVENSKYEKAGIDVPEDRELLGQAPYSINAGFGYKNENGFQTNINYNTKGKTLSIIGLGQYANVYEIPVHKLDLKIAKSLGVDNKHKLSLTGRNLLDQEVKFEYDLDKLGSKNFSSYKPGRDISFGYTYAF